MEIIGEILKVADQKTNPETLQAKHPSSENQYRICELCKDRLATGLLGRLCPICERKIRFEQIPELQQRAEYMSVVPKRYMVAEMEHLPKKLQEVFKSEISNGVLLWGTTGSGKTYAMAAFAKNQIAMGYKVMRVHYEVLCLKLRDTFNPNASETEWKIIEPLLNCDMLFIEDVGVTKSIGAKESDFSRKTFLVLLDIRMEHMRPTLITTNKSVENIKDSFDERIGDRLRIFQVFNMNAKSKR